jgi:2,3-bisphosphoglycerate-dependent phosphoglycerate mutase
MRCYFIRHGQSTNNLLYENTGSTNGRSVDPILTKMGSKQAKSAGKFFAKENDNKDIPNHSGEKKNTHIYTSLMVRAIGTGNEISRALNLPLFGWKDLHEQGGIFHQMTESGERIGLPGKRKDELTRLFPNLRLLEEPDPDGWWNRPHETTEEARQRGKNVLSQLLEKHGGTDDRVILVSHGAFYACFMSAVLNLQNPDNYWFVLNNTGITRLDFLDKYTYIVYQNYHGFLKKEQIS